MNKISHFILHSWVATAIAALLCMGVWVITLIQGEADSPLSYLNPVFYVGVGILIAIHENEHKGIGRHRFTLPATLFFMTCALNPQLAPWQGGILCLILLSAAYRLLLGTYRHPVAMGSYYAAFLLAGTASLVAPQLLYLLPALLLCSSFMQSLHLRTALAALFGALTLYWTAFCVLFLTDSTHLITPFVDELTASALPRLLLLQVPLGRGDTFALPMTVVQLAWTLMLVLPAAVYHLKSTTKVRSRAGRLMQLCLMGLLLAAMLALPALRAPLQPTVVSLTAILSHGFFTPAGKGRNIWLIVLLSLWLLILGLYVWNSYLTY